MAAVASSNGALSSSDAAFPCSLSLDVALPTHRLASVALKALRVDPELSPLVRRDLSIVAPQSPPSQGQANQGAPSDSDSSEEATVLRIEYHAATNRMLRVAANSFLASLNLVLEVMEQLDIDVIEDKTPAQIDVS